MRLPQLGRWIVTALAWLWDHVFVIVLGFCALGLVEFAVALWLADRVERREARR